MRLTCLYEAKKSPPTDDPNDKEQRGVSGLDSSTETKGQTAKGPTKHPSMGASRGPYKGPTT